MIYTSLAVSIILGGAVGLFLVLTALFDLVTEDLNKKPDSEIAAKATY